MIRLTPSILIPLGLANIKSALLPAISILPVRLLGLLEFTWLTIAVAEPVAKNGFPSTHPAVTVFTFVLELFKIVPFAPVLNSL